MLNYCTTVVCNTVMISFADNVTQPLLLLGALAAENPFKYVI